MTANERLAELITIILDGENKRVELQHHPREGLPAGGSTLIRAHYMHTRKIGCL